MIYLYPYADIYFLFCLLLVSWTSKYVADVALGLFCLSVTLVQMLNTQIIISLILLTLFRMGLFGAPHGWGEESQKKSPLSKICHTYPTKDETCCHSYTLSKDLKNI